MWYRMEYYAAFSKDEDPVICFHEGIMVSEIRQSQKDMDSQEVSKSSQS